MVGATLEPWRSRATRVAVEGVGSHFRIRKRFSWIQ